MYACVWLQERWKAKCRPVTYLYSSDKLCICVWPVKREKSLAKSVSVLRFFHWDNFNCNFIKSCNYKFDSVPIFQTQIVNWMLYLPVYDELVQTPQAICLHFSLRTGQPSFLQRVWDLLTTYGSQIWPHFSVFHCFLIQILVIAVILLSLCSHSCHDTI